MGWDCYEHGVHSIGIALARAGLPLGPNIHERIHEQDAEANLVDGAQSQEEQDTFFGAAR